MLVKGVGMCLNVSRLQALQHLFCYVVKFALKNCAYEIPPHSLLQSPSTLLHLTSHSDLLAVCIASSALMDSMQTAGTARCSGS